jgi:hypothetical protein
MARALSPEEAEVFSDAISPEQNLALAGNPGEDLATSYDEVSELTRQLGFWFLNQPPKS